MSKKHKSKKYARKHKPEPHGVSVSYEVGPAVMHHLYELIGHGFRAGLDYLRAMALEERQANADADERAAAQCASDDRRQAENVAQFNTLSALDEKLDGLIQRIETLENINLPHHDHPA